MLAAPAVAAAAERLGRPQVKRAVAAAQQRVREGVLLPTGVVADVLAGLPDTATSLRWCSTHAGAATGLPDAVRSAVDQIRSDLAQRPFAAPEAHRLAELGLGTKQRAAAVRAGELLKIADGIYLAPGADDTVTQRLRTLPNPFTLSQARQALDATRRLPDGTHELRS